MLAPSALQEEHPPSKPGIRPLSCWARLGDRPDPRRRGVVAHHVCHGLCRHRAPLLLRRRHCAVHVTGPSAASHAKEGTDLDLGYSSGFAAIVPSSPTDSPSGPHGRSACRRSPRQRRAFCLLGYRRLAGSAYPVIGRGRWPLFPIGFCRGDRGAGEEERPRFMPAYRRRRHGAPHRRRDIYHLKWCTAPTRCHKDPPD